MPHSVILMETTTTAAADQAHLFPIDQVPEDQLVLFDIDDEGRTVSVSDAV